MNLSAKFAFVFCKYPLANQLYIKACFPYSFWIFRILNKKANHMQKSTHINARTTPKCMHTFYTGTP